MKPPARIRLQEVGAAILTVVAVTGVVAVAVCAPNALQLLKPFMEKKKYSPQKAVDRNIRALVRSGLLRTRRGLHGDILLELTKRGKWTAAVHGLLKKSTHTSWDGVWRIVMFDIPNVQNRDRAESTRGMKVYGFKLLQRSVWVYPYPCDDFVEILRQNFAVKNKVIYLPQVAIEDDMALRQEFKLQSKP